MATRNPDVKPKKKPSKFKISKKSLKSSSFLKIFSLQAGTCVICSIGTAMMISVVFYNSTEKDYLDPDKRPSQYGIMYTYACLMFIGMSISSLASFLMKPTVLKFGGALVLLAFLLWLIASFLSFDLGESQLFRYVCLDNRCPPTQWLFESGWRNYSYNCSLDDAELQVLSLMNETWLLLIRSNQSGLKPRSKIHDEIELDDTLPSPIAGEIENFDSKKDFPYYAKYPKTLNSTNRNTSRILEVPRKLKDFGCHLKSPPRLFATALFFTAYTVFIVYALYIFYMLIKEIKEEEALDREGGEGGGPLESGHPPGPPDKPRASAKT